ncbi:hypothetical protein [Luteipulveratus mongoliensis]|uniref:Secreted protein n=1 Tax=Luteipulveratus mongoliensis TaxID=571913 RepID=A0A0K1JH85_9MICO|nr:hypothetical protein [Luteipulveratus mongoliensis]AKU15950.1 hypothetical protein VV02_08930 [Luteipulveratus mongoliensis]
MPSSTLRLGTLGLAAATLILMPATATATASATAASASDQPVRPVAAGYAANADAAASRAVAGGLLNRYASSKAKATGVAPVSVGAVRRTASAVPVYELSPAFVRSGSGPVGQARYAVTTYALGGESASVASAPQPNGSWQAVNVASGDTESRMSALAKGSPLLHEPQVDAWYAVRGDRVVALDGDARRAIGGGSVSVAAYAGLVHAKYADKLPGSAYDTAGYAGGYAAQSPKSSSSKTWLTVAAGGVVGAELIAWFALRRRRSAVTTI